MATKKKTTKSKTVYALINNDEGYSYTTESLTEMQTEMQEQIEYNDLHAEDFSSEGSWRIIKGVAGTVSLPQRKVTFTLKF